jgi:uncharacterized protein YgiM (DUF1202 family)
MYVFGIIIGVIVLFLICRELICWYYKINRIVALLEDQICLLKMQVTFVPTHTIKYLPDQDELNLRKKPSFDDYGDENLPNGTKVQFLEKMSKEVKFQEIKGTWFKVITQEKIVGWCFSGNLEKT